MRARHFCTVGFLVFATPALADDARKIDFTQPVVVDGKPVINDIKCALPVDASGKVTGPRPCNTAFTLGELAAYTLNLPTRDQQWQDGVRRNELANHVRDAKDWPILKDQVEMIEKAMGPVLPPPVLGAVAAIFDQPAK